MEIVNRIKLDYDNSVHNTRQKAERHISDLMCRGDNLALSEELATIRKRSDIMEFIYENESRIRRYLTLIKELKEVEKINIS